MSSEMMDRLCEKAPCAAMFRSLYSRMFSEKSLDAIFAEHAEQQVESDVLFSYLVNMLSTVVTGASSSVNAAHQQSEHHVSFQAVYDKLKGIEPQVSAALVRSAVPELRSIQDESGVSWEDVIPGYHTFVMDGKTYNATEHRLKESRTDSRAPLPGRAIALLDTRYELFVDVECDQNAHRCERKISEPILERLEAGALYIADRNFCDGIVLSHIFDAQAFFIVRQHGACPSWRETSKPQKKYRTRDSGDGVVSQAEVEIKLDDGSWRKVRRITVRLKQPTRDGDKVLHLLTNLPTSVTGPVVSDAYRGRWKIETCLGYLAQALNAEIKTLAYPQAAGLCFCLALTLFNIMSTVKSHLEQDGRRTEKEADLEVSYYYMSHEIMQAFVATELLIDNYEWNCFAEMATFQFTQFFRTTASNASLRRYRKHYRGPKKKPPKRKFDGSRHVATQKLLDTRTPQHTK